MPALADATVVPMLDLYYWSTVTDTGDFAWDAGRTLAAGIECVLVRAGKGWPGHDPDHGRDRHLDQHVFVATANGVPWFPFWRVYRPDLGPGSEQARHAVEAVGDFQWGAAPFVVDVESVGVDVDRRAFAYWLLDFVDGLAAHGIRNVAVYTRQNWWDPFVGLRLGHLPLLVAHYFDSDPSTPVKDVPSNPRVWDEAADEAMPDGPNLPAAWNRWSTWQIGHVAGSAVGLPAEYGVASLMRRSVFEAWW